jgi:hypothetical protein
MQALLCDCSGCAAVLEGASDFLCGIFFLLPRNTMFASTVLSESVLGGRCLVLGESCVHHQLSPMLCVYGGV